MRPATANLLHLSEFTTLIRLLATRKATAGARKPSFNLFSASLKLLAAQPRKLFQQPLNLLLLRQRRLRALRLRPHLRTRTGNAFNPATTMAIPSLLAFKTVKLFAQLGIPETAIGTLTRAIVTVLRRHPSAPTISQRFLAIAIPRAGAKKPNCSLSLINLQRPAELRSPRKQPQQLLQPLLQAKPRRHRHQQELPDLGNASNPAKTPTQLSGSTNAPITRFNVGVPTIRTATSLPIPTALAWLRRTAQVLFVRRTRIRGARKRTDSSFRASRRRTAMETIRTGILAGLWVLRTTHDLHVFLC